MVCCSQRLRKIVLLPTSSISIRQSLPVPLTHRRSFRKLLRSATKSTLFHSIGGWMFCSVTAATSGSRGLPGRICPFRSRKWVPVSGGTVIGRGLSTHCGGEPGHTSGELTLFNPRWFSSNLHTRNDNDRVRLITSLCPIVRPDIAEVLDLYLFRRSVSLGYSNCEQRLGRQSLVERS